MSATLYGPATLGFGVSDETSKGYYIADLSIDASSDEVFLPDHKGEDIALVLFNAQATMTGNGATVTANEPFHTLQGILSVNSTGLFGDTDLGGGTAFTKFYVNGLGLRDVNRDFQQGNFSAVSRTGITDATGTAIT